MFEPISSVRPVHVCQLRALGRHFLHQSGSLSIELTSAKALNRLWVWQCELVCVCVCSVLAWHQFIHQFICRLRVFLRWNWLLADVLVLDLLALYHRFVCCFLLILCCCALPLRLLSYARYFYNFIFERVGHLSLRCVYPILVYLNRKLCTYSASVHVSTTSVFCDRVDRYLYHL